MAQGILCWNRLELSFLEIFKKAFSVQEEKISENELQEVGTMIENLYKEYGENPLFRTEFEAFLVKLLKRTDKQALQLLFSLLPLSKEVRKELVEDLEEAYKSLSLQKEFQKREAEKL